MSLAKKKAELNRLQRLVSCWKLARTVHIALSVQKFCSQQFKDFPEAEKKLEIDRFFENHQKVENALLEAQEKLKDYAV